MDRLDRLFADYAAYHRTRGNLVCHTLGIPLIMYSLLGILLHVRVGTVGDFSFTAAEGLILLAMVVYAVLDLRFMGLMFLIAIGLDALARVWGSMVYFAALFIIGWVFQGVGHAVYEKRSPAFFKNFVHLLIGPIFILNEYLHLRPSLPPASDESE